MSVTQSIYLVNHNLAFGDPNVTHLRPFKCNIVKIHTLTCLGYTKGQRWNIQIYNKGWPLNFDHLNHYSIWATSSYNNSFVSSGSVSGGASGARAPLDFKRFQKGPTQFVKNVEIFCFYMDFCGFGHHSTKIATGATVT